jgi:hypothetical protein
MQFREDVGVGLLAARSLLPFVKVIHRHKTAPPLERLSERRPVLNPLGLGVHVRKAGIEKTSLISLTSEERRTRPHMP